MKKRLIFYGILTCITCLLVELTLRIFFAFQVGPEILLYGTTLATGREFFYADEAALQALQIHQYQDQLENSQLLWNDEDFLHGYTKFRPDQRRYDTNLQGEKFLVTINSSGLRGKDFSPRKSPGVARVITLGASSTFGYHDRDNETYPYYLEELLNQKLQEHTCPGVQRFEVLNFGIPHQTSAQIYFLFISEAIKLDPDIVTFYEGVNDSALFKSTNTHALLKSLRAISVTFAFVDSLLRNTPAVIPPSPMARFSEEDFQQHLEGRSEFFLRSVSQIAQECQRRGILFIVANQQAQSYFFHESLKGITYEEEGKRIRAKLAQEGRLSVNEVYFLTHNVIMDDLKAWALSHNIPFVDVISALNQDRDQLTSWVHLTPKGNQLVATQFTEAIWKYFCF